MKKFDKEYFTQHTPEMEYLKKNGISPSFVNQEYYGDYICISESVHEQFHRQYGKGGNTREQWNEFIKYYNNSNIA